MKRIVFVVMALMLSSSAVAAGTPKDYTDALHKAAGPCEVMLFQANLDRQNARLSAQMNGTMQAYVHELANSKPDPKIIACWDKARADAAVAYKTFAATTKSEKVKESAKAVLSAWLNNLGTDGVSNRGSHEAAALSKAESDLEVEVMTE